MILVLSHNIDLSSNAHAVTDVPEVSVVQERSQRTSLLHTTTNHIGHVGVSKSFTRRTYHNH